MNFFIVTPSHNQAKFIKKTLDGVTKQKGDFGVLYCVFDGVSSDKTVEILKKYDKGINWESKKDRGQTHAINKGVAKLKTWLKKARINPEEVIFAYLNSDDYYLSGTFEKVVQKFNQNPDKNWLVGDAVIVDEKGKEIQKSIRAYKKFWRRFLSKNVLGILNPIPQPATFIRASAILKTGNFTEKLKYVMDYEYWLRLWKNYGRPILINKPLAAFRIHGSSKGGTAYKKQFAEQYNISKKFFKNPGILALQRLQNFLINAVYNILK